MENDQIDRPDPAAPPEAPVVQKIEISGRFIWQAIGAVLVTLFLLWAVNQARGVVSMVAISFFFSLALQPAVLWLTDRYGWRRGSATGVIFTAAAVFVVVMVLVLIPAVVRLATAIGEDGAGWLDSVSSWSRDTLGVDVLGEVDATSVATTAEDSVSEFASGAFGSVLGLATSGLSVVFNLATIAMFTFYFTADAPGVQQGVLRLFKPNVQQRIGWTWDQAIVQTGGYFYSRMILFLINGVGFFFTMVAVGMPVSLAAALALFGGFVSVFIPAVGTYIGGAVPVLLTAAVQGLTAGLIVLGYVLVYQQLENYWLSPKISAETMSLNGGVAFGAALAGGAIGGPMGAFTALPIAALISSFISNYVTSHEVVYHSEPPPSRAPRSHDGAASAEAAST